MTHQTMQTSGAVRSGAVVKQSAELTTYVRAVAAKEPDPALRCPDALAARLIGIEWQRRLKFPLWLIRSRLEQNMPGTYFYVLARTRHIDRLLTEALWGGIEQLVILGAGFDSRAYRFQGQLSGVRVFEVDSPGNQAVKKERLASALGSIPAHVTFLPVDFNQQPLSEALISEGYQTNLKTFFIWEGVSYYLTAPAVDAVLKFAAVGCGVGSSIVFDYALESFVRGEYHNPRTAKMGTIYAASSEPFVFGIPDGRSGAFLRERGLRLLGDLGPAELEQQYLRHKNGSLYGRPSDFVRIAHACNG